MSEELKPCPFCGCNKLEVNCEEPPDGCWGLIPYRYGVFCAGCCAGNRYYGTREEAISAWNTRAEKAERICHIEEEFDGDGQEGTGNYVCSSCNGIVTDDCDAVDFINFCPNCGAKVVDE